LEKYRGQVGIDSAIDLLSLARDLHRVLAAAPNQFASVPRIGYSIGCIEQGGGRTIFKMHAYIKARARTYSFHRFVTLALLALTAWCFRDPGLPVFS
jgi:hypothetical protein